MTRTVLVVDDKKSLRDLVSAYLREHGYRVVTAEDGRAALFAARHEKPDLILLDIMMPNLDGYDFMRLYGRESETPVILLTAKLDETDKVLGLELGADDYVTKPFSLRELVARVRAVLRRVEKGERPPPVLRAADVVLDRATYEVTVGGRLVALTPTEFELLATLIASPGRVYTRAELLDAVQGVSFEGLERAINTHISNLRHKIEPDRRQPRYVETVFGVGYRFAAEPPER